MRRGAFLLGLVIVLSIVFIRGQDDSGGPLYALPSQNEPFYTSSTLARTNDGRTLVAANSLNDTVSFVDLRESNLANEITVGDDPRGIVYTPDESRVLVVERGDGTLSVIDLSGDEPAVNATYPVGLQPYAVVTDRNTVAYVALQGTSEIVRVDLNNGDILDRIPTPAFPSGLLLWGDFLYVTHLWSGNISLIYLPQMTVVRTVDTGGDTSLFQNIALDPAGIAYLPQSRSHAANRALTYDNTVLPIVNVMDLGSLSVQRERRIALGYADQPVNMPFAATVDSIQNRLYVANAGSNDVSVIDLDSGLSLANLEVGANPRSILLSRDRSQVYVHNVIDGTLAIIEARDLTISDVLPISNVTIPVDILLGAELFHAADDPRLSNNDWMSCASCHFDGQSDGRVWSGFPGGARNTPVLYDLLNTAPYTWTAIWDELADVELKIRRLQAGGGLIDGEVFAPRADTHAGLSPDLDTLVAYLVSLDGPASPVPEDAALVERGEAVFAELECAACHTGETFTDTMTYDVGTGGEFDTPTLRWLWQSAPYFHDGRAETLLDVFTLPGVHQLISDVPPDDINALIAYLLSLPRE